MAFTRDGRDLRDPFAPGLAAPPEPASGATDGAEDALDDAGARDAFFALAFVEGFAEVLGARAVPASDGFLAAAPPDGFAAVLAFGLPLAETLGAPLDGFLAAVPALGLSLPALDLPLAETLDLDFGPALTADLEPLFRAGKPLAFLFFSATEGFLLQKNDTAPTTFTGNTVAAPHLQSFQ